MGKGTATAEKTFATEAGAWFGAFQTATSYNTRIALVGKLPTAPSGAWRDILARARRIADESKHPSVVKRIDAALARTDAPCVFDASTLAVCTNPACVHGGTPRPIGEAFGLRKMPRQTRQHADNGAPIFPPHHAVVDGTVNTTGDGSGGKVTFYKIWSRQDQCRDCR